MVYTEDICTNDMDPYQLSSKSLVKRSSVSTKIRSQYFYQILSKNASKSSVGQCSMLKAGNLLPKKMETIHYLTPISYYLTRPQIANESADDDNMQLFTYSKICLTELSVTSSLYLSSYSPDSQRTIIIRKRNQEVILRKIYFSGFQVIANRPVDMTPEQKCEIYTKQCTSKPLPDLVVSISAGPNLIVSIPAKDVLSRWKTIIGPDGTLKDKRFYPNTTQQRIGIRSTVTKTTYVSHKASRYFYTGNIFQPVIPAEAKLNDFGGLNVNPTQKSDRDVEKSEPIDPILYVADWLLFHNPYLPRLPYKIAVTPTPSLLLLPRNLNIHLFNPL